MALLGGAAASPIGDRLAAERAALEERIEELAPAEHFAAIEELAMRFHAQSFLSEAIGLYARSIDGNPGAVRARYLRALAMMESGEDRAVLADLEWLFDSDALEAEHRALVGYRLGVALFSAGEPERARARLIDALLLASERAAILVLLSDIAAADGQWDRARGLLERAFVEQSGAGQIAYKLAIVHRELGDQDTARQWLERRNDVAPAVTDPWLLEVAEFSESPRMFLDLAEQSWQRGDHADAIAGYERAAELAPEDAGIWLGLAIALAATDQNERARQALDVSLELDADDPRSWYLRARLDSRAGETESARRSVSRSIDLEETDRARALRANLSMRLALFADAVVDYESLTADRGDDAALRYWLALARLGAGGCHRALDDIDRAVALQPNWGEARIVAIRAAAICGDAERREKGAEQARRLASLNQSPATRITLAFIEWSNGEREIAERLLEATEDHPDAVLLREAMGRDERPDRPFAAGSSFWVPPGVRAPEG